MSSDPGFARIPTSAIRALTGEKHADLEVFLPRTEGDTPILYRRAGAGLSEPDIARMREHGVLNLFVRAEDLQTCEQAVESRLTELLNNPDIGPAEKAEIMESAGTSVAKSLIGGPVDAPMVARAGRTVDTILAGLLHDPGISGYMLRMAGHERSTASHMFIVSTLAVILGAELYGSNEQSLRSLAMAGLLHDLGKLSIPKNVLNKNGTLTRDELAMIHQHPIESVRLIGEDPTVSLLARQFILQHHERVDGRGYPIGLGGGELLTGSKILTIVDSFHALIGRRSYRASLEPEDANRVLSTQAGRQFDAELLNLWVSSCRRHLSGMDKSPAAATRTEEELSTRHEHQPVPNVAGFVGSRPRRFECNGRTILQAAYVGRLMPTADGVPTFGAPVHDVSRGGVCIYSAHPMYRGEIVNVRVATDGKLSWVRSMVAWCRRKNANVFRVGLRFLDRIAESRAGEQVEVRPLGTPEVAAQPSGGKVTTPCFDDTRSDAEGKSGNRCENALETLSVIAAMKDCGPEAQRTVITLAMSGEVSVRLKAVDVLAGMRTRMTRDALVAMLKDSDETVLERAIAAVGSAKLFQGIESLAELLRGTNRRIALRAAGALGRLGDERGLPLVASTLETDHPEARVATQALTDITGHRFPANREGIKAAKRYLSAKQMLSAT